MSKQLQYTVPSANYVLGQVGVLIGNIIGIYYFYITIEIYIFLLLLNIGIFFVILLLLENRKRQKRRFIHIWKDPFNFFFSILGHGIFLLILIRLVFIFTTSVSNS